MASHQSQAQKIQIQKNRAQNQHTQTQKTQKTAKKPPTVTSAHSAPNRDILQRLNFTYQATALLAHILAPPTPTPTPTTPQTSQTVSSSEHRASRAAGLEESGGVNKAGSTSTSTPTSGSGSESASASAQSSGNVLHEKSHQIDKGKAKAKVKEPKPTNTKHPRKRHRRDLNEIIKVAKKSTSRLDPSIKRTLCPTCSTLLIPGHSVSVRIKPSTSHKHRMRYTCTVCAHSLWIPAPRYYQAPDEGFGPDPLAGDPHHPHPRPHPHPPPATTPPQPVQPSVPPQPPFNPTHHHHHHPTPSHHHPQPTPSQQQEQNHRPRDDRQSHQHTPLPTIPIPIPITNPPLFARPDAGHIVFRGDEPFLVYAPPGPPSHHAGGGGDRGVEGKRQGSQEEWEMRVDGDGERIGLPGVDHGAFAV